ncbi:alpha-L-fucosidase [Pontiella agarivorans]|uniref:alpha-L-fucosidase n=1 Tax=Pontiella agarivorans TaxID=3038953 RepID=A0ABU5N0H3_9BACT|nr:alpha-L-fucosidase [Pontiella agarivorans]MDZ8119918.1 alpha-L-fucosidase [Pontiella agarivorans]
MKKVTYRLSAALMIAGLGSSAQTHADNNVQDGGISVTTSSAKPAANRRIFKEEWPSIAQHRTPEWFRDAKFGIYTCLAPATVATQYGTTEWYGWAMYNTNAIYWNNAPNHNFKWDPAQVFNLHREKFGDQHEFGYKDFIQLFQPTNFNAAAWADLFEKSGAKFSGPMGVHHDNYYLWDSEYTRWDIMDTVGFDMCAELEKEIRKRDMKYVMTFHHAFTWWFFYHSYAFDGGQPGNEDLYCRPHEFSSDNDSFAEYPDAEYEELWFKKLEEACVKYDPDLIWFDMGLELLSDNIRKKAFARLLNNAEENNQDIGLCYKIKFDVCIPPKAGILDYEKGRSTVIREDPWLTDTPLGGWFYNGRKSRSPEAVIEILVDIVSKNGCMLLCVSPKPDGTIPDDQQATLLDIGEWLKMNGEAVYDTRPWIIAEEGPTKLAKDGHFNENWEAIYTEEDIRYTRSKNGDTLYVIVLDRPTRSSVTATQLADIYPYLDRGIKKAELIGTGAVDWIRDNKGLHLDFPADANGKHAWCYKLTLAPKYSYPKGTAQFDWSEASSGEWWNAYGYRETDNNITLITGGRTAAHGGTDGTGGVGHAIKAAYEADSEAGTFEIESGGEKKTFKVNAVDIAANRSKGEFIPSLTGKRNGKTQWTIHPETDRKFHTYTEATTGDLSKPIDIIEWNTGVSANPGSVLDNLIDNLNISIME